MRNVHRGYTLRSGRRLLGTIRPAAETRGAYLWSSNFTKDRGITGEGLDQAIRIILREAGMSPRQFEIDLVDVETGKRRRL